MSADTEILRPLRDEFYVWVEGAWVLSYVIPFESPLLPPGLDVVIAQNPYDLRFALSEGRTGRNILGAATFQDLSFVAIALADDIQSNPARYTPDSIERAIQKAIATYGLSPRYEPAEEGAK